MLTIAKYKDLTYRYISLNIRNIIKCRCVPKIGLLGVAKKRCVPKIGLPGTLKKKIVVYLKSGCQEIQEILFGKDFTKKKKVPGLGE